MEPLSIGLIAGLTAALIKVGEKILEKATNTVLDTPAEGLRNWLYQDLDRQKAENELNKAVLAALDLTTANLPIGGERLRLVLRITGQSIQAQELLAAAAVGMVKPEPRLLPATLLEILGMNETDRETLAAFLFDLRLKLAITEGFNKLIDYANELDQRGLLQRTVRDLERLVLEAQIQSSYLKNLAAKWGLNPSDKEALDEYLQDCLTNWGDLSLPLIRERTYTGEPVRLKQVFVPLYLRDLEKEEKNRREMEKHQRKGEQLDGSEAENNRPVDLKSLLNDHQAFILLGPPGIGKTTLLRRAALAFAEGRAGDDLQWNGKLLFPIFLRLRNFGEYLAKNDERFVDPAPGALIAYLENLYQNGERILLPHDFFDRRLKAGDCLIFMDGLDEVTENRELVAQQVNSFIKAYKPCGNRFGLSSRPKGFEGNVRLLLSGSRLSITEVAPLDPTGIRRLIHNLLEILQKDHPEIPLPRERLPQRILASNELTKIAGIPLFCSALVQVYFFHQAELPERRVDVLDEIVILLLGYWESSKPVSKPIELGAADGTTQKYAEVGQAVEVKLKRLRRLAGYMHTEIRQYEIDASVARQVLATYLQEKERGIKSFEDAENRANGFLLNSHERSGLLVEIEPETETNPARYAFAHQAFMEYLAATDLVNQPDLVRNLLDNIDDNWWEQVILMAGAHPKTPDYLRGELVCKLLEKAHDFPNGSDQWRQRLVFAGHLARDMAGYLSGPERQAVEDALLVAATDPHLHPVSRAEIGDALDEIYQPQDIEKLVYIPASPGLPAFYISKYPVTNGQYQRFLEDPEFTAQRFWVNFPRYSEPDKHGNNQLIGDWGDEGWQWLVSQLREMVRGETQPIVYPRSWNDPRFGIARRGAPVIGLTFYEANAYCRWLIEHWQEIAAMDNADLTPGEIRLPTEQEWIAAAGGAQPPERFPWDTIGEYTRELKNKNDPILGEILQHANLGESGINKTTPVYLYPSGKSQHGVWDLGGNAWEWLASHSDKDRPFLALRGGSWLDDHGSARLSARNDDLSGSYWSLNGFRVVVSPS